MEVRGLFNATFNNIIQWMILDILNFLHRMDTFYIVKYVFIM